MAFTYSGDPAASRLDRVRFEIGDTDAGDALLQDAEIQVFLTEQPSVLRAAAFAAEAIAAKFSRQVSATIAGERTEGQQKVEHYVKLARRLRARALRTVAPVAGGLSKAEQESDAEDADLIRPSFRRGMHDHPATSDERDDRFDKH